MKSFLPDIINRSTTPSHNSTKDSKFLKISPNKTSKKPLRHISLSPISMFSSRKDSSEIVLNPRAASDEVSLISLNQMPLLQKISNIFHSKNQVLSRPASKFQFKLENYQETVKALFSLNKCEKGRIQALSLIQLFVSLGFAEDCDLLIEIFKGLGGGQPLNLITFNKQEIFKICEESRTENVLRAILKDSYFKSDLEKSQELTVLNNTLKKWWKKIDLSRNGFVPIDEICRFYAEVGVIETASDSKRMVIKFGEFVTFKQFCSVFSKAIFKYLIIQLTIIVKNGNSSLISPDLLISTQRRKVILRSLEEQNKVLDAIIECKIYNN